MGSSHEIDAAEGRPGHGAGSRSTAATRPRRSRLLGLHAGAAVREDHATVRAWASAPATSRRGVGLHQRAGRPVAVAGVGQQRLVHVNLVAARHDVARAARPRRRSCGRRSGAGSHRGIHVAPEVQAGARTDFAPAGDERFGVNASGML